MLFRLAALLGRTVGELEQILSAREFREWCEFYSIEPWGCPVDDGRAGIIASTVANVNRGRNTPPYKPEDFVPKRTAGKPRRPTTKEELIARAAAFDPSRAFDVLRSMGGKP